MVVGYGKPTVHRRSLLNIHPYIQEHVGPGHVMVYVPGKEVPTKDERDAGILAGMLGVPMYSLSLRGGMVRGNFLDYQYPPDTLLVVHGMLNEWQGQNAQHKEHPQTSEELVNQGICLAETLSPKVSALLFTYVDDEIRRKIPRTDVDGVIEDMFKRSSIIRSGGEVLRDQNIRHLFLRG